MNEIMPKQAIKSIAILFKYAPYLIILKFLQILLLALTTPLTLYITQHLIDSLQGYMNNVVPLIQLVKWGLALAGTLLFSANSTFIDSMITLRLRSKLNKDFMEELVQKFNRIEYSCFEDSKVQDHLNKMGNHPDEKILEVLIQTLTMISQLVSLLSLMAIFLQVSVWFTVAFLAIFTLMVVLNFKAMKMMNGLFTSQSRDERELSYLGGLLSDKRPLLELKVFGAVEYIQSKWKQKSEKVLKERLMTTIKSHRYFAASSFLLLMWIGLVIFELIHGVLDRRVSVGLFVSLIGASGSILGTADDLSLLFSRLSHRCMEIMHYEMFMQLPERQTATVSEHPPSADSGPYPFIEFRDVCFTYPGTAEQVLKKVSFTIQQHEHIALVGGNGAGKSTIVKLLMKLYAPDHGEILIYGVPLNQISQENLRNSMGIIFQDYGKYSLTLRENIAFGNIAKIGNDNDLRGALTKAAPDGVLSDLDTALGKIAENGIDLSGGQWQKIAMARAYLADCPFMIMDEPTAALDPVAESELYATFRDMMGEKGCLFISHRLASARFSDRILVLQDGAIAEDGTHEHLIGQQGMYANLWSKQSSWYRDSDDYEG
ncbi:ABC transporter ATP-binding protein [Paenibacillus piscarius]|uniref:ABC transporter ATP-binding protein n=1 Tax=Paenibacillus piscarius TaxID=1089681 RepID=UPI001EE8870A|nr:ABC transporter ATP-binding protein [Paenibacillus piscarius]